MPRFAANLTFLFTEYPPERRIEMAAKAGFDSVEILYPYERSIKSLRDDLECAAVNLVLINTPEPHWSSGSRGLAACPGRETEFRSQFEEALDYATALDVQHIHVMSGISHNANAEATFISNLEWAAARAPDQGLTIEPINPIDMPGYFLNDFKMAERILDAVAAPNLTLQFDTYHAHILTGDVIGTWEKFGRHAGHVQVAGFPGRHEPTGGQIDYPAFFTQLDSERYTGVVSGEYNPESTTEIGLGWCQLRTT
ncbi:TIM barrel protein [uncultured Roseovarius sp.]|uniref:hydroxypyruvate isomerase family protein n=1 Tax=uncultured Roseovarius sp. TaxID=293344 RepID=UPI0026399A42|nr:TIM barrel protein [uncultured Roseovarius sp.]